MTRHVTQMRPQGEPGSLPYSPQRDLANIYLPMLKEVFQGLDKMNWPEHFPGWLDAMNISQEDFGAAVNAMVEAHRLFVRDREVATPAQAFEKAGFTTLPAPIRVLLFERLGVVLAGGFFIALRDTTLQGMPSPQQADMAEMVATGRVVATLLSGHRYHPLPDEDIDIETIKADASETTRANHQLIQHCAALDQVITTLERRCNDEEQRSRAVREDIASVLEGGFFRRLRQSLRLIFRRRLGNMTVLSGKTHVKNE